MALKNVKLHFYIYAYGRNFGGAFWQGDNTMVMHWLMESVVDIHML